MIKLCDGNCGNVYKLDHLNRSIEGFDFCNDCMFDHLAEQDEKEYSE